MIDQPIPTVLSIHEGEPGYRDDWPTFAGNLDIFLDGVEQTDITAYDCAAGTVKRGKRDASGMIMIEGDEFVMEVIRGTVEVRRKPE